MNKYPTCYNDDVDEEGERVVEEARNSDAEEESNGTGGGGAGYSGASEGGGRVGAG